MSRQSRNDSIWSENNAKAKKIILHWETLCTGYMQIVRGYKIYTVQFHKPLQHMLLEIIYVHIIWYIPFILLMVKGSSGAIMFSQTSLLRINRVIYWDFCMAYIGIIALVLSGGDKNYV